MLLLLTVPFQAAIGSTGHLCPAGHHSQGTATSAHSHDGPATAHEHTAPVSDADHETAAETPSGVSHGTAAKCKICSECCVTAAAILTSDLAVDFPDTALRVSVAVSQHIDSRAGDGLFRPPRNISA